MTNSVLPKRARGVQKSKEVATYRLGIFDLCDDTVPIHYVGRIFGDNEHDRDVMAIAIHDYGELVACREGCTYAMAAFRDYPPPTENASASQTSVK
jgi:hypothetical protein